MKFAASITLCVAAWAVPALAAGLDLSKLPPAADKQGLTFDKDIKPILEASCTRCHGNQRAKGGLHLTSLDGVLKSGDNGPEVIPGKSKDSPLVIAVARLDPDTAMPPSRGGGGGPGMGPGRGGPGDRGGFGPGALLAGQMMSQGDKNADKKLSRDEFTALADAWFEKIDADKAGKVNQRQFSTGLAAILPQPQGAVRGDNARPRAGDDGEQPRRGGDDGAQPRRAGNDGEQPRRGGDDGEQPRRVGQRFNPAAMIGPALFSAADSNKDGSLTQAEWKDTFTKWFDAWDTEKTGQLSQEQIANGLNQALPRPNFGGRGEGRGGPGGPPPGDGPGPNPNTARGPGGPGDGPSPDSARPSGQRGEGRDRGDDANRRPEGDGEGRGQANARGAGGPTGPGAGGGNQSRPLTAEQVGIIRAWIDQGAK